MNNSLPVATKRKYKNGLTHIHYYVDRFQGFDIGIFINAGSIDERKHEQQGVAHFLEHMVFNGSSKYPSRLDLDFLNSNAMLSENAWTWCTTTCYYISGPNKSFELAADILIDRVLEPLLREVDVEKERGIIIEELNRSNSRQESVLEDKLNDLLTEGTGYAHRVLGDMESLKGMNPKILKEFHKEYYTLDNMVLVTYGGVTISDADTVLSKHFVLEEDKSFVFKKELEATSKIDASIEKLAHRKLDFTEVPFDTENPSYSFSCILPIENSIENMLNVQLLEILLGEGHGALLEEELVFKKSLVDSFGIQFSPFRNMLEISFLAGGTTKNIKKVRKIFAGIMNSVAEGKFSEKEFNRAKNFMLGQLFFDLDEVKLITNVSMFSVGYLYSNYKVFYDYEQIYNYLESIEIGKFKKFVKKALANYTNGDGFVEGMVRGRVREG